MLGIRSLGNNSNIETDTACLVCDIEFHEGFLVCVFLVQGAKKSVFTSLLATTPHPPPPPPSSPPRLSGKLIIEFTNAKAKSTSPELLDNTFFACGGIIIAEIGILGVNDRKGRLDLP